MKDRVWVVVRESADIELRLRASHDTLVVIRGVCSTKERAQQLVQQRWDEGERPQCRIEEYLLFKREKK